MRRTSLHFLDDIKEAAGKIRKFTTGMTYEEFLVDEKTQDAVIRNFEVIGEAKKTCRQNSGIVILLWSGGR